MELELEVKENKFYILITKEDTGKGLRRYNALSPSVKRIREFLKSGVNTESIELTSVELKGDKFEISSVPWNIIAMELIKE